MEITNCSKKEVKLGLFFSLLTIWQTCMQKSKAHFAWSNLLGPVMVFGLCSRNDIVWLGIWVEDIFPDCPQEDSAGHADSQELDSRTACKEPLPGKLGYCHIHSWTADRTASDVPEDKESASPDRFTPRRAPKEQTRTKQTKEAAKRGTQERCTQVSGYKCNHTVTQNSCMLIWVPQALCYHCFKGFQSFPPGTLKDKSGI